MTSNKYFESLILTQKREINKGRGNTGYLFSREKILYRDTDIHGYNPLETVTHSAKFAKHEHTSGHQPSVLRVFEFAPGSLQNGTAAYKDFGRFWQGKSD